MPPPVCEEIHLFIICEAMNWAHLPEPGGLYQQNPLLLERWEYIFLERAAAEEEKRKKEERERKNKAGNKLGTGRRGPSRGGY